MTRQPIAALFLVVLGLSLISPLRAEDKFPDTTAIRAAVTKALPLLEKGAKGSMTERKQCFTCHNQGPPILALSVARSRGFEIDAEHLQAQLKFTAAYLDRNRLNFLEGRGQGGQVDAAGQALWTLDNGGWQPDETTDAVMEYFLKFQKDSDHWRPGSNRPPSVQSRFTTTFVALRGLKIFGTSAQQERIDQRINEVREWLIKTPPEDTEDRVFRLRALWVAGAASEEIRRSSQDLLKLQRPDGGWAQLADLESDAYATGSALVALHQAGGLTTDDACYRKGLDYLISNQLDDGSWHVVTRAKPFQPYFESGYPHEKDQFISIAAAGWATTALALALPETPDR